MSRSHSTISREIRRNKSECYVPTYYPHSVQRSYAMRMRGRVSRGGLSNEGTKQYVISKLKIGWTPELISGRLKLTTEEKYICHESIYQYIYKEAKELIDYLPRKHNRRRKKYPIRARKTKTSFKTSTLERPSEINDRSTPGHWESDSIESKGRKLALNVVVERVSRISHITKLSSKKALATKNALVKKLTTYPKEFVCSVTYDNGPENAGHLKVNEELDCKSYFCQAYHSWEKGAVEQVNGLIRRYLPKGTDFASISPKRIEEIENRLNSRPRKCLGYKTPFEIYNEIHGALPS
ncbi:IS30 family transposase [Photobacterium nomapromontoriensis]